jgi:glutathione S-transferase
MATATDSPRPILWQLQISHYNEKVRWALDYKRIAHTRRSLLPGIHRVMAQRLAGIDTTPVLTIGDESVGDSTAILAEIERRWPEPQLYPDDPAERKRALELEEYFDEELGPHIRRAIYWVLLEYPHIVLPLFTNGQPPAQQRLIRATFPLLKVGMRQIMNIHEEPAARSREKCVEALDTLERELDGGDYLVGDRFSVADLTAASLFYPLAMPPEFPYPSVEEFPPEAEEFLNSMNQRPGALWVADMYRRHREPS